jgi:hypothetical protein
MIRSVRTGAFFYVLSEAVAAAHEVMRQNGYQPYIGNRRKRVTRPLFGKSGQCFVI